MQQFFHPSSFRIIQLLFESVHYDFVNSLGLTIPLEVSWGRVPICNSQITVVSLEGFAIKLKSIVRDEGTKDLELGENIFPNKLFGVNISYIRQKLGFNPFSEIFCTNQ